MPATLYYTADMVRALPEDGNKYETVYGELLVTPSPRMWHQVIVQRLYLALHDYIERHALPLYAFGNDADISWGPDTLVQPDVFVADIAEVRTMDWANVQHLALAIEVLSPSSTRADRFTKRRLYQNVGAPSYWIVDPEARTVEVWTPEARFPRVQNERVSWTPAGASEALAIELGELFRAV